MESAFPRAVVWAQPVTSEVAVHTVCEEALQHDCLCREALGLCPGIGLDNA